MLTAEQAFLNLINDKSYLATLARDEQQAIASYKSLYKKGKLKLRNIDTLLEKHGFRMAQEAQWIKAKLVLK